MCFFAPLGIKVGAARSLQVTTRGMMPGSSILPSGLQLLGVWLACTLLVLVKWALAEAFLNSHKFCTESGLVYVLDKTGDGQMVSSSSTWCSMESQARKH
jgi:hypothetical protein